MRRWADHLRRLPRYAYWLAGALIACGGALAARLYADRLPIEERTPIWLIGAMFVFLGICVLSLGTHTRLESDLADRDRS